MLRDNPYQSPAQTANVTQEASWFKYRALVARFSLTIAILSTIVFVVLVLAMISNDVFITASEVLGMPAKTLFVFADLVAVGTSIIGCFAVLGCTVFGNVWQRLLCVVPGLVLFGAVAHVVIDFVRFRMWTE